ncbi:lipopolysaccharide assembly protein LapA domain-containing protein [Amaricoccus macauensis]|uniref:lipopolysaccharide assembly protein LapA domain-containing protein n=1 Tax=Amaricoccus macauensis TaxID=57001 RepID=UPI003C7D2BBD
MRTIKLILLGIILLAIVVLGLANREPVTLELLPQGLAHLVPGASIDLPLFVVILAAILVGLVLGYLFEYLREYKHRKRARQKQQEATQLNREVDQLRKETKRPKDDVLALLGN